MKLVSSATSRSSTGSRPRDLAGIGPDLRAAQRLWDKGTLPGLYKRRDDEAALTEQPERSYSACEFVRR